MRVTLENIESLAWEKMNGMIPAVVQHKQSGQVLMMAWVNQAALIATLEKGKAVFFSRKRQKLWCKGETSGHFLKVREISADCDLDTLLMLVDPDGPACHKGTTSCWTETESPSFGFLHSLEKVIHSRKLNQPENSYVTHLLNLGIKRMAQKVGEEGVETALAASSGDKDELVNESADLLFHLMVLLSACDLSLTDVIDCLTSRHS